MRVLVCPDEFGGTLTASEAAEAVAAGWLAAAPGDEVVVAPLSDGGPGFLDVVDRALNGRRLPVPTWDPLGRPVTAEILLTGGAGARVAYLESAQTCGLHRLAPAERDPKLTTSYGLGALVAAAVEAGAREIVVGLGGSATNDAGAGLLTALGVTPLSAAGSALPYGGAALAGCAALDGAPRLRDVRLTAAADVDNPLCGPHGASAVYGPQKGACPDDVVRLDAALRHFAGIVERDLPGCPRGLAELPGGGAAGGLGAAILALGGRRESGIGLVRRVTGLDAALAAADVVITGEGSFDAQSLRGKAVAGVAAAARERAVPCLVLAGRVTVTAAQAAALGVTATYSLVDVFGEAAALAEPAPKLRDLARKLARAA